MCVCMYVRMYVRVCVCMYVCMHACMCTNDSTDVQRSRAHERTMFCSGHCGRGPRSESKIAEKHSHSHTHTRTCEHTCEHLSESAHSIVRLAVIRVDDLGGCSAAICFEESRLDALVFILHCYSIHLASGRVRDATCISAIRCVCHIASMVIVLFT